MQIITSGVFILLILQGCFAPPVINNNKDEKTDEKQADGLEDYMEYHRYLREVVNALESDPEFRQKLEKAEEQDIRTGKIAHELEFVSHHVRTRLDEIKRAELDRLRDLMEKKQKLTENISDDDPNHHHLDHSNPHTFEIEDLKRLIAKTTEDLAEADRKRREEFKQYELQKEFEKQAKLNNTNGEEKAKLEKELKEQEEKHKKHEPLHEPGHKKQLEEVWEEQDHMQQEFDPKTFFMLHDLDSNGLWDQDEVKALFVKELDKMYSAGAPEDDMRERVEEMERMRETVFREVDVNKDGFIDYEEFLAQTRRNDFQQDHGWQGIDEQKPYTDEELAQYIRQQQAHYPYGYPPPHYGGAGYPPHPGQMQGYHPNQMQQQQGYGQQPGGGVHPNVHQQAQFQQGQHPQFQQHQGQQPQQFQQPPGQQPQQFQQPQGQQPQQFQQPPGQQPQQFQQPQGQQPQQFQHQQGQPQFQHPQFQQQQGQQHPVELYNAARLPDLNTNEIYPNNQGNQAQQFNQQYQSPNQPAQMNHQGQINRPSNQPGNNFGQVQNPTGQLDQNQFHQQNQLNNKNFNPDLLNQPGQNQHPNQFQQNNFGQQPNINNVPPHVQGNAPPPVQQKKQELPVNVQGSPQMNKV